MSFKFKASTRKTRRAPPERAGLPLARSLSSDAVLCYGRHALLRRVRRADGAGLMGTRLRICAFIAASNATAVFADPAPAQAPPGAAATYASTEASLENSAVFVADAFADINFINLASRMAIAHTTNEKIRDFAIKVAKGETAVGMSVKVWMRAAVHKALSAPAPSPASYTLAEKFRKLRLRPSQRADLQHLSSLQGRDFDAFYISTQKDALLRLKSLYEGFAQNDADSELHAIAAQELPEVEHMIVAVGGL
jgi:predicted outer membrane protein